MSEQAEGGQAKDLGGLGRGEEKMTLFENE